MADIKLTWKNRTIEVSKEEAEKILNDQELRKKNFPKATEFLQLEDKSLIFDNGVITRKNKGNTGKEA